MCCSMLCHVGFQLLLATSLPAHSVFPASCATGRLHFPQAWALPICSLGTISIVPMVHELPGRNPGRRMTLLRSLYLIYFHSAHWRAEEHNYGLPIHAADGCTLGFEAGRTSHPTVLPELSGPQAGHTALPEHSVRLQAGSAAVTRSCEVCGWWRTAEPQRLTSIGPRSLPGVHLVPAARAWHETPAKHVAGVLPTHFRLILT